MEKSLLNAAVLTQALPYIKKYAGCVIVIKYGGNAMGDSQASKAFAEDIVLLKQVGIHPIVVHGGGPQIGEMLDKVGVETHFDNGLRVTNQETMDIAEMVLAGSVNKSIVSSICAVGGKAVGICGKDANLITVEKVTRTTIDTQSNIEKVVDLGFVGHPTDVDVSILKTLENTDFIPVIAPVALGKDGKTYNVNADVVAGAIAGKLQARRLLLLTDVTGVLDKDKNLVEKTNVAGARRLLKDGTISGGMIPKITTCIESIEEGLHAAVIVDGRVEHAVLLELLTDGGVGTLIQAV